MIGVNTVKHKPKELKEVMDREKLNWRSFADQGDMVGTWHISGTPTYYLIDPRGVIRYKWPGAPGAKAIDTALEKLIHEAEAETTKAPK